MIDYSANARNDTLRRKVDQLRADLERIARERDAAERTAEARRTLLRDKEAHVLDLCASNDVLRGAVRETDAAWDREIEKSLELTARIATALSLIGQTVKGTELDGVRAVLEGDAA